MRNVPASAPARAFSFEVIRKDAGWYVVGVSIMGPFAQMDAAERFASGLVQAINEAGGDSRVIVRPDDDPTDAA